MKKNQLIYLLTLLLAFSSCKKKTLVNVEKPNGLKEVYKNNFLIGVAINANQINEKNEVQNALIKTEFNSITPENIMKSLLIHPKKDTFNFELSDKLVGLAEKNNMHIQGHTLVWHSQLSPFFKEIKDSTEMVNELKNHINTIVGRYKGKIDAWDVVNEALNDDGTLRKTAFLDALGEDYLSLAFDLTKKVDPDAELYYNDYSMTIPAKRAGAIKMIKRIQELGTKIDGIGMQGHWDLNTPSIEEIEKSIKSSISEEALGQQLSDLGSDMINAYQIATQIYNDRVEKIRISYLANVKNAKSQVMEISAAVVCAFVIILTLLNLT